MSLRVGKNLREIVSNSLRRVIINIFLLLQIHIGTISSYQCICKFRLVLSNNIYQSSMGLDIGEVIGIIVCDGGSNHKNYNNCSKPILED